MVTFVDLIIHQDDLVSLVLTKTIGTKYKYSNWLASNQRYSACGSSTEQ